MKRWEGGDIFPSSSVTRISDAFLTKRTDLVVVDLQYGGAKFNVELHVEFIRGTRGLLWFDVYVGRLVVSFVVVEVLVRLHVDLHDVVLLVDVMRDNRALIRDLAQLEDVIRLDCADQKVW